VQDIGTAPVYNRLSGNTGRLIRYYVTKRNDVGKTITLFGKAFGGQPLQEKDADGDWRDGLTITARVPYGTSSVRVSEISAVVRQPTQGMTYLYEYNPDTDLRRDLAVYEPSETNPRYRVTRLPGFRYMTGCTDDNGIKQVQLDALVKLAFVPVKNDWDFLYLDNFEALKFAIQAIRLEEANDDALAEAKMLKAVRELNYDERNRHPDNQTPVRVRAVLGGAIMNPI